MMRKRKQEKRWQGGKIICKRKWKGDQMIGGKGNTEQKKKEW